MSHREEEMDQATLASVLEQTMETVPARSLETLQQLAYDEKARVREELELWRRWRELMAGAKARRRRKKGQDSVVALKDFPADFGKRLEALEEQAQESARAWAAIEGLLREAGDKAEKDRDVWQILGRLLVEGDQLRRSSVPLKDPGDVWEILDRLAERAAELRESPPPKGKKAEKDRDVWQILSKLADANVEFWDELEARLRAAAA